MNFLIFSLYQFSFHPQWGIMVHRKNNLVIVTRHVGTLLHFFAVIYSVAFVEDLLDTRFHLTGVIKVTKRLKLCKQSKALANIKL